MRYPLGKFAMILAEVGQEICGEGEHERNVTKKRVCTLQARNTEMHYALCKLYTITFDL